ncbi:hypothetical protein [Trinickia acidisoli]|uniref:hypothetical protein n=1 Tax=Trinickia acidisoli TaxID=2767482 RepID=UPI001A8DD465|nr:hypothetical protein [Trinickia acidisoli]
MSTPTREEFEARIEAVEARMDARVAAMLARFDAFEARADERERRFDERLNERDKRLDERDRRLDERDKRFELLTEQIAASAKDAYSLRTHMWLAASTVILATVGTVVGAYYATQSSHLGLTQAVISAFQQGQQTPSKE